MLEFDGQPIDPAIVSAQPMKPAQNMDLPQMVCPPGTFYKEKLSSDVMCHVKKDTWNGCSGSLRCNTQIFLVHPESRLSQPNTVPVQSEPAQVSNKTWTDNTDCVATLKKC